MRQEEGQDNLADMLANLSQPETEQDDTSSDAFETLEAEAAAEAETEDDVFDESADDAPEPEATDEPDNSAQVLEPVFEDEAAGQSKPAEEVLEPIDIGNVEDSEYEHPLAQYSQTQRNLTATLARRPVQQTSLLRKIGIPTLIVLGVALLVPGVWAVGIFAGWELPLHEKEKVKSLAVIMLVCWPLALLCFLSAAFMFIGLRRPAKRNGRGGSR
ncbi:hypothetical protein HED60_24430 [Planctomycetales bacterium ZRK34]|nr:hypothetical protein HED60_24430 [Planctomycetales bacterium ZRK34]